MTTALSQIGWGSYHAFEGPMYIGNLKVPMASINAGFAQKVLSITAAAEGGHYDAINCYDAGLVSVGAIQFIDAGQFNVCNMLGLVADKCGIDKLNAILDPVFQLTNAKFIKTSATTWRFYHPQTGIVTNAAQQKLLYFGDSNGNNKGSYNDKKTLLAKTWAMCMANVWTIPGAIDVQTDFTKDKLMTGFTWGNLKAELFSGQQNDTGIVGAMRALILAFAVNSPATVVKHYDVGKTNKYEKFSESWCYEVLREIVINGGVDVWKARWSAKKPYVDTMFSVSMPTYSELVYRTWKTAPEVQVIAPIEETPNVVTDKIDPDVTIVPVVIPQENIIVRSSIFDGIFSFFKIVIDMVLNILRRK